MKIECLKLQNFRCFGPEGTKLSFEEQVTAFVGGNGSGKTALFQALSRLFGVTRADRTVSKRDFHIPQGGNDLADQSRLEIECLLDFPELAGDEGKKADAVPDVFKHMAISKPGESPKARIRLVATWIDDGTPDGTVEEDIKWITTLDDVFDWETCTRVSPVDRSLIQLVYVPAFRNAAGRVTDLLKGRLWKSARWSDEFEKRVNKGSAFIQKQFNKETPATFIIERLTYRWRQVYKGDTDTDPNLKLIESKIEDLVRRAEFIFHPDEAGRDRSLSDLSDGQRSLFHIALTAAMLEIEQNALALAAGESPFDQEKLQHVHLTILAIEEPENNLSPFFLSRIMTQTREIGQMDNAQVLISSHSASILSRVEAEEIRYFRLDRKERRSSVKKLKLPDNDQEASTYVRLAVKSYPELYFARFVILAEGDSERIILPRIAEAKGIFLDSSFVPVVPLGGRYVSHFWRLLEDLAIPYATLLDFDIGRVHGGANMIRTVVSALKNIGRELTKNRFFTDGKVNLDNLEDLTDNDVFCEWEENYWAQGLRQEGIFFSDPIDLDFSMLSAFSSEYQHPKPGGRGPNMTKEAVIEKKKIVLKKKGVLSIYNDTWDDCFAWYPYLFLNGSKPETHLAALSRIEKETLAADAPQELCALIDHVGKQLYPEEGQE